MPPIDRAGDPHNAFVERRGLAGIPGGALSGTSFAVKDNVAVQGMAFTAGHPLFADRRAGETAPAVRCLLDAGADFVGMTQTDAGGFGATTPQTRNPAAAGLIVGGSSGGSAAAIAAGYCDFAIGTDTGGSVRIPAACTGLAAFKPSYGRISNDGVWPLTPQLDHVGLIARDLAMLRRASLVLLDGARIEPAPAAASDLRIAVEIDKAGLFDPGIAEEMDRIAEALQGAGHMVDRIAVPGRENIAEAHGVIVLSEAAAIYADCTEEQRGQLGKAAATALRHAQLLTPEAIEAAWEWARAAADRMKATLIPFDVLISPTLPVAPPSMETRRIPLAGEDQPVVVAMTVLTCLANLTGNPVISFPNPGSACFPKTGTQLLGHAKADEALFGAADRIFTDLQDASPLSGTEPGL